MLQKTDKRKSHNINVLHGRAIVHGWSANIQITPTKEIWRLGFSKEYSILDVDDGETIKNREAIEEKKPHGFLLFSFLKAARTENTMEKWCIAHGLEISAQYELIDKAETIQKYIDHVVNNPESTEWQRDQELIRMTSGLKIEGFEDYYIMTADENDFVALIVYEFIELIRLEKRFDKCYCGAYYLHRKKQHKPHCPDCPPPSRLSRLHMTESEIEKHREATRKKVSAWRKNRKAKAEKERMDRRYRIQSSIRLPSYK